MRRLISKAMLPIFLITTIHVGCTKLTLRSSSSLINNITGSFFEECDLELARQSLPSNLKLLEGILKEDPGNRVILKALCMGFTGYGMLFCDEEKERSRISSIYVRARNYGLKALFGSGVFSDKDDIILSEIKRKSSYLSEDELDTIFWTSLAWNCWVNLNLDNPRALVQIPVAELLLKKVLDIDPAHFHSTPRIIAGTMFAAKPPLLGGDPDRAKSYFEEALSQSHRNFFLAHYYYARYYAVRIQDKALFLTLIDEVTQKDPSGIKDACILNAMIQKRILRLRQITDELFY